MSSIAAEASSSEPSFDIPGICSWDWDVIKDRLTWSAGLYALYGVEAAPANLDGFLAMTHPDDRDRVEAVFLSCLADGSTIDLAFRIVRSDGALRHVIDRGRIFRDEAGRPLRLAGANIDITDFKEDSDARLSSERRDAYAARIGGLVSWEIEAGTGRIIADSGLAAMFGLELNGPRPAFMDAYVARIHPQDVAGVLQAFNASKFAGGQYSAEYRVRRGEGWYWTRGEAQGVMVDGELRLVGFNVDIEDERRRNAQIDLIAHELAHRVKNILTIVQAVALQTFPRDRVRAELDVFTGPLRVMACSNDFLMKLSNEPVPIADIIRKVVVDPTGMKDRVKVSGDPALVPEEMVLPVVLGLHELCTNALKYGALSNDTGEIAVTCSADPLRAVLVWQERGGPRVIKPERSGFGTRLLTLLLARDFGGSVVLEYVPAGLRCELTIPLAATA